MSMALQISLNKKRITDISFIQKHREDCRTLQPDEVAKKLLFEKIDEVCNEVNAK